MAYQWILFDLDDTLFDFPAAEALRAAFAHYSATLSAEMLADSGRREGVRRRLQTLSPREGEVARLVALGEPNKVIAAALSISEKTVHIHRQHVMEKMGISSAAELARLMLQADPSALD